MWPFIFFHVVCFQSPSLLYHESLLHSFLCAGSYGHCSTFWRAGTLFSKVTATFCIPINNVWEFQFSHILTNTRFYLVVFFVVVVIAILVGVGPATTFCLYLSHSVKCDRKVAQTSLNKHKVRSWAAGYIVSSNWKVQPSWIWVLMWCLQSTLTSFAEQCSLEVAMVLGQLQEFHIWFA